MGFSLSWSGREKVLATTLIVLFPHSLKNLGEMGICMKWLWFNTFGYFQWSKRQKQIEKQTNKHLTVRNKEGHHQHNNGNGFIVGRHVLTKTPQREKSYNTGLWSFQTLLPVRAEIQMLSKWTELKKSKVKRR